uniref:AlNc14C196G8571 protein n=1 Tax=Albugo laibachii Nc14 TaxID=890382 RepID=F0WQ90_9STRA|nr:AlNc14C196G8571 [Albugo laibachii Nc14]|eukprot:CCA23496.1 AlNc14C196G8571 [Albugo laibachii Nc14]
MVSMSPPKRKADSYSYIGREKQQIVMRDASIELDGVEVMIQKLRYFAGDKDLT